MKSDKHFGRDGCDVRLIVLAIVLTVAILYLSACQTLKNGVSQTPLPDTNVYYFNDLGLTINGVPCFTKGVCVGHAAPSYSLKINSPVSLDQLVVSTAKRTDSVDPDTLGKQSKGYVYTYTPGHIETDPGTKLKISGYTKDGGEVTSGIVVFEHEKYKLTAGVSCNAIPDYGATGVAICQSMKGQKMLIWFPQPVHVAPRKLIKPVVDTETDEDRRCQIDKSKDGKYWTIVLPDRECEYEFETDASPYLDFLLFTVGAEKMPIRGN